MTTFVRVSINTAAIGKIESDAFIVVAHNGGDLTDTNVLYHFVGEGTVTDKVTQAICVVGGLIVYVLEDGLQGVEIGVNIGEDGYLH